MIALATQLALTLLLSGSAARPLGDEIAAIARRKAPEISWDAGVVLVGDVNDDGREDYVVMGQNGRKVHVAVVLGPKSAKSRVDLLWFGVGNGSQSSFCEPPTEISLRAGDLDPSELTEDTWEGFRKSTKARVVVVGGDGCDPFYLYWNHKKNALDWQRS